MIQVLPITRFAVQVACALQLYQPVLIVSIQPTPAVLFPIALRDRGRAGDAHAGIGGIQGLPARALRIAAMTPVPCLRAVSR